MVSILIFYFIVDYYLRWLSSKKRTTNYGSSTPSRPQTPPFYRAKSFHQGIRFNILLHRRLQSGMSFPKKGDPKKKRASLRQTRPILSIYILLRAKSFHYGIHFDILHHRRREAICDGILQKKELWGLPPLQPDHKILWLQCILQYFTSS